MLLTNKLAYILIYQLIPAYVQQIGRAGRSGQQAKAVMYYTKSDLASTHINEDMITFCKNDNMCHRKFLSAVFNDSCDADVQINLTKCCNICNKQ